MFHQGQDKVLKYLCCPHLNDIQFSVIEDEINQEKKQGESKKNLLFIIIYYKLLFHSHFPSFDRIFLLVYELYWTLIYIECIYQNRCFSKTKF